MIAEVSTLVNWAFSSSLLILLLLLLRRTGLTKKLSRTACYALWLPVLLRLLLPVQLITTPFAVDLSRQAEALYTIESTKQTDTTPSTAPTGPTAQVPIERPTQSATPSAPTVSAPADSNALSRSELVLLLWKGGAAALAAAIAVTNLAFARKLHRRRVPLEGASDVLPVYTVEGLDSPCLVGVLRPAIYLSPADAQNEQHLRHIVAHEESHCRGGDPLWSILRAAALCLHWYDPFVWYAAIVSKRDAELACDERTLRRLGGEERAAYGETLLSLTMAKPSARDLLSCSTAMVGGKKTLRERIEGIAHSRRTRATAAFAVIAILALALVFAFGKPKEAGEYERFIERVEAAERIAYHPPAYSNSYYPALTDPDRIAEAKELLLTFERADERDVPAGDLNIFMSSGVSLDGEYRCYFLNVDGVTLVYLQKPDAEGVKDKDFTLIGKYTDSLIASRLCELAGGQAGAAYAIKPTALSFLTELQTSGISSAVLTVEQVESSLEDGLRDEIFSSLRDIAAHGEMLREVTDEGVLRGYPVYDFSAVLTLSDGTQITLYPIFTHKGSVLLNLTSDSADRRFVLEDANSLYSSLLYAAGVGDVTGEQRKAICDQVSVPYGDSDDLTVVARSLVGRIVAAWMEMPSYTVWKPLDVKIGDVSVTDSYFGEDENFLANVTLWLKFDGNYSANFWQSGAGLIAQDADGYWRWGGEMLVELRDGAWVTDDGIGGAGRSVNVGFRFETAGCEQLVKAFTLTSGFTHDDLIPSYFCDLPASERAKLGAVLDGYTKAQASDFLRAVSDHLAQYPTYHELTVETLYAELPDKYKDFTLILAAEPLWTGSTGDGRFALYDYGKAEWALLYKTGDVREIVATYHRDLSDPNDSITAFAMDDLLGFPGVAVQSDAVGAHKSYDYYARTDYGVQYVGYSFGFYDTPAECTFSVDFDGDGRSELITDNIYGADGAERVTVFRWNGAASEVGSPDWSKAGIALSGIGAMDYQEGYDAARGVVTLSYRRGEEIKTAELPLTPENFMWLVIDEL